LPAFILLVASPCIIIVIVKAIREKIVIRMNFIWDKIYFKKFQLLLRLLITITKSKRISVVFKSSKCLSLADFIIKCNKYRLTENWTNRAYLHNSVCPSNCWIRKLNMRFFKAGNDAVFDRFKDIVCI